MEDTNLKVSNIATLNKVVLPVIRRVSPTIIANDIIGVQALTDETGEIKNNKDETVEIKALTRNLAARWTFQLASDAEPIKDENGNKIDIEAEIMAALAQEVCAEVDQEIIYKMIQIARVNCFLRYDDWTGSRHYELAAFIISEANRIKVRLNKKKNDGFWCIVSPTALTILQSDDSNRFVRHEQDYNAPTNTKYVGKIGDIKVFVNQYALDNAPVLVGYKGSESDAAVVYSPYVMLTSTGITIDPYTFEPVCSFKTQYGFYENENASGYLGLIDIDTYTLG